MNRLLPKFIRRGVKLTIENLAIFRFCVILLNMNWKCANFYNDNPNRLEVIAMSTYCPYVVPLWAVFNGVNPKRGWKAAT